MVHYTHIKVSWRIQCIQILRSNTVVTNTTNGIPERLHLKQQASAPCFITYHGGSDAIWLSSLHPLQQGLIEKLLENRGQGLRAKGCCQYRQQLSNCPQQFFIIGVSILLLNLLFLLFLAIYLLTRRPSTQNLHSTRQQLSMCNAASSIQWAHVKQQPGKQRCLVAHQRHHILRRTSSLDLRKSLSQN